MPLPAPAAASCAERCRARRRGPGADRPGDAAREPRGRAAAAAAQGVRGQAAALAAVPAPLRQVPGAAAALVALLMNPGVREARAGARAYFAGLQLSCTASLIAVRWSSTTHCDAESCCPKHLDFMRACLFEGVLCHSRMAV